MFFPYFDSRPLDAWIVDPYCPFGFQHLRVIHVCEARWRLFQSCLAPGLRSIEHLKLAGFSGDHALDLSGLTNLKQLDVYVRRSLSLTRLIALLGSLSPNNSIHTIFLGLLRYFVSVEDEKNFKELAAAITALDAMHSLRRVEIFVEGLL
ncbi:hypothetical protein C8R45DRAFT_961768 [Mycena sanguinolenta]|nr:hypothetical protein C8R45DRAFT_961768 [Mycena sanguinolenta]